MEEGLREDKSDKADFDVIIKSISKIVRKHGAVGVENAIVQAQLAVVARRIRDNDIEPLDRAWILQVFTSARKAALEIPPELLDYLASRFEEYLGGDIDLADAFCLTAAGRGKTKPLKMLENYFRDASLVNEIIHLKCMLDVSNEEAAHMVYRRLEVGGIDIASRTILDAYYADDDVDSNEIKYRGKGNEFEVSTLDEYPVDSIPPRYK